MIISIYALAGQLSSKEVYFSICDSKNGKAVFSPLYQNEEACLLAIRQTILSLRALDKDQQHNSIHKTEGGFEIHLLVEGTTPFMGHTIFRDKSKAAAFLTTLQKDSKVSVFSISHFELNLDYDKNKLSKKASDVNAEISIFSSIGGITLLSTTLADDTAHSFSLKDENGRTILSGQKFNSSSKRDQELFTTLRCLLIPDCFEEKESDGLHFFSLRSIDGSELGDSIKLANEGDLKKEIQKIQNLARAWAIACLPEYSWKESKSSTLNLSQQKGSAALVAAATSMPAATLIATQPCAPIFNLLRPYGKADIDRFFGREAETEDLYGQTFDTRLLVVYGERFVGKTSLVQCGLANRLKAEKWHDLYIRRWWNINGSLRSALHETAIKLDCQGISKDTNPMDSLRAIYLQTFQPVLLVFDQLEELFTLPYSVKEQQKFFLFLQELIQDTSFPSKVILIIRDEYLAKLADYETIVPTLLEHRFHLKHLSSTALKVVVNGLLGQLVFSGKIRIEEPELVSQKIQKNLAGDKPTVGLACTQVYLHQVHQLTCTSTPNELPVFSPGLIDRVGKPEVAIRSYVEDKITSLEKDLPRDQGPILNEEQAQEIEDLRQMQNACGYPETEARSMWLAKWHERGQRNKQLVLFLRLCILALLFIAIALGVTYCSLAKQKPCLSAQEAENCEARINYLCHYGINSDCAENLIDQLDKEDCPVWIDYKSALRTNSCESYRAYVDKYRAEGICLDTFYQLLADRNCPTSTDTITITNTVTIRDTVTKIKTIYVEGLIDVKPPSSNCDLKFGVSTLKLGPLFMMTSDLDNGTRYNWIGALAACKRLGPNWRLPCAGEIQFILDKHYKDAASAYQNLTSGPCPIFRAENASLSGNFWTATEANDQDAWSIFFDTKDDKVRMVSGTDKKTTLPCRCVYRDPSVVSGIPDCFEKQINPPNQ